MTAAAPAAVAAFLVQIAASVGLSSLVAAGIVFLAKTWIGERIKSQIKSEYDLQLESHKAQLKNQADIELERLRSALNTTAYEHQILFSGLQEKRAETIAELYALIKDMHFRLSEYVKVWVLTGDKDQKTRASEAYDACEKFLTAYRTKALFIPKATRLKIETFENKARQNYNLFSYFVYPPAAKDHLKWTEIAEAVDGDLKNIVGELEDDFERALGSPVP